MHPKCREPRRLKVDGLRLNQPKELLYRPVELVGPGYNLHDLARGNGAKIQRKKAGGSKKHQFSVRDDSPISIDD